MNTYSLIIVISSLFVNTIIILIMLTKVLTHLEHRITKIETLFENIEKNINILFKIKKGD